MPPLSNLTSCTSHKIKPKLRKQLKIRNIPQLLRSLPTFLVPNQDSIYHFTGRLKESIKLWPQITVLICCFFMVSCCLLAKSSNKRKTLVGSVIGYLISLMLTLSGDCITYLQLEAAPCHGDFKELSIRWWVTWVNNKCTKCLPVLVVNPESKPKLKR